MFRSWNAENLNILIVVLLKSDVAIIVMVFAVVVDIVAITAVVTVDLDIIECGQNSRGLYC